MTALKPNAPSLTAPGEVEQHSCQQRSLTTVLAMVTIANRDSAEVTMQRAVQSPSGSGRAIARLPALAGFTTRPLLLAASGRLPAHLEHTRRGASGPIGEGCRRYGVPASYARHIVHLLGTAKETVPLAGQRLGRRRRRPVLRLRRLLRWLLLSRGSEKPDVQRQRFHALEAKALKHPPVPSPSRVIQAA